MSILDTVVGAAKQKLGAAAPESGMMDQIMGLLGSTGTGGLERLVQKFKAGGLGDIVSSWISTGKNLPISSQQIQQVPGSDTVKQFAQKAGVAPDAAANSLAQWLPVVIDKLTPSGQLPAGDTLSQGLNLARSRVTVSDPDPQWECLR
ncbi:MAG: hypothetical protein FD165_561 [Gammaproteobacteria bacterium]|nr:MAG: hypothetical protein FD165_561 [Gammaproteobacteria bacterium]TND02177.1 MAG: hypothetical protein FD120_2341 [Gammaproteobacteria bacterium]